MRFSSIYSIYYDAPYSPNEGGFFQMSDEPESPSTLLSRTALSSRTPCLDNIIVHLCLLKGTLLRGSISPRVLLILAPNKETKIVESTTNANRRGKSTSPNPCRFETLVLRRLCATHWMHLALTPSRALSFAAFVARSRFALASALLCLAALPFCPEKKKTCWKNLL